MSGRPLLVDALGTWCPVPVTLTARAIARVPPGGLVEVWADDPLVAVDLPAWCHRTGHALERMTDRGGQWSALVRRAGA